MDEVLKYLENFIEKESEVFSGFPVCPFAKRERLQNKIKFVEINFSKIDLYKISVEGKSFLTSDYSTLLFISNDNATFNQTKLFFRCVTEFFKKTSGFLSNTKMNTFFFHEQDDRSYNGLYTRRSPVPFIMVGYKHEISKKKNKLLKTKYYEKIDTDDILNLNPKRKHRMSKIKRVIEKIRDEEGLTTQEVLTKYPDLAILLEQEEQQEKLNESNSERVLLKG